MHREGASINFKKYFHMPITRTIYTCIVEVDRSHSSNYTQIMQLMYSVADIVYTEDT